LTDQSKAVFVSYASDDQAAAQRLCDGLRGAGVETWFDVSELRGGDAWDANIRRQIRDCALFVPIVSASTESRGEGYFRLEWRLAVERSFHFADDQAFLMPVVIDGTAQPNARVPERFRERQWTSLPGGNATPQFIANVRKRLAGAAVPAAPADAAPPAVRRGPARALLAALAVGVILAALLAVWLHRGAGSSTPAGVASAADRKSIAVLPFENLTGHTDDAYLADGLQEEILNALARVRDLKVISRTSVAEYRGARRNIREIGNRLGVGTVLEGSVRRDANTLRLTFQLISVKDDVHLLAANYDRDLTHILGLQSEVAHKVAAALSDTLSRAERGELDHLGTNNGDAYLSYLKAVALFQQWEWGDAATVTEPTQLLEEAIRLDPEFADAYALQSRFYTLLYFRGERAEDAARARAAYERALAIDPGLIEARLARGVYELYVAKNPDRALADLEAVASLRPSSPSALQALALVLRRRGRMDEAVSYFRRAWDLDPLAHTYDVGLLTTYTGLRRFSEALEWARLHEVRFPDNPAPQMVRARIQALTAHSVEPLRPLLQRSDVDSDSRKSIEAEIATAEGRYQDAIALWEARSDVDARTRLEAIAFLCREAGDTAGAEQRFRALERDLATTLRAPTEDRDELFTKLALAQSVLGEHEAALTTIDEARALIPESLDQVNGPPLSFLRSVLLARAGRTTEAYAEVERLLHVPFGSPLTLWGDPSPVYLLLKSDPHFDELLHRPPRL
jgi:TolB-like protein